MGNLAIIHFSPLEMYPPVQNFIRQLEKKSAINNITVFTTKGTFKELDLFCSRNKNIRIVRLGSSGTGLTTASRIAGYTSFYLGCFFQLIIQNPRRILYYETISSFPAWLYRRFNKGVEILIHYHEYTSPAEYATGMRLTKVFHRLEKWLYPKAKWISHTNEYRMQLFEKDLMPVVISGRQIVPNYPPKAWSQLAKERKNSPVKIVYTGSLSMNTMYTKEFTDWVLAQNGLVAWHIYSYNITDEAKIFLQALNTKYIVLKEGINYEELPAVLSTYDVGVILYKGHIPNYIYNAPNKLFEYLVCGLDVWFPDVMTGTCSYQTANTFPKVIGLNFEKTINFPFQTIMDKTGLELEMPKYFCDDAFTNLAATFSQEFL